MPPTNYGVVVGVLNLALDAAAVTQISAGTGRDGMGWPPPPVIITDADDSARGMPIQKVTHAYVVVSITLQFGYQDIGWFVSDPGSNCSPHMLDRLRSSILPELIFNSSTFADLD